MTAVAHNPRVFIAYAPRAGLRCALAYLGSANDVYGWYTGPDAAGALESRYFVLEGYYSAAPTRLLTAADSDLHSEWIDDEARCHELAELQDAFVHEWLFYRADAASAGDAAQYARGELALGDANVKFARLARLSKLQPTWTYASREFEDGVLEFLAARWALDYGAGAREREMSGSPQ